MQRSASFAITAALGLCFAAGAQALDFPKRKSGLWEVKTLASNSPAPHSVQMCVDEQTDDLMQNFGASMGKKMCSKNELRKEGDKYIGESVCSIGTSTASTHSEFTGDFTTAYRGESKTTYSPPLMGMSEATTRIEAKWLGPCKPGQKPGDIVMTDMPAGMPALNLKDLQKLFKP